MKFLFSALFLPLALVAPERPNIVLIITEVYRHGGVGQTPDVWDNAYFDGSYIHNGRILTAKGLCTDVFFGEAKRFNRECAAAQKPFFAYIAPNAPHTPLHAPKRYMDMYAGQPAAHQS